jgi:KUP system potassium uptake protein
MKINQTNSQQRGQIYIPVINSLLAAGSIALVLVFQSSAALAGAYTFAISGTMLITTICIYWVATEIWKTKKWILYPTFVFFVALDLAFLIATSTKILTGAWLPLAIGLGLALVMWTWRKGRVVLGREMNRTDITLTQLEELVSSNNVHRDKQVGIYLSAKSDLLPQSLEVQVRLLKHIPEEIYIVSIVPIDEPYSFDPPSIEKVNDFIWKITIKNGFMESRDIPEVLNHETIRTQFNEADAMYYLTDRSLVRNHKTGLNRAEESVFIALHRNASKASKFFKLPSDRVVSFDVKLEL